MSKDDNDKLELKVVDTHCHLEYVFDKLKIQSVNELKVRSNCKFLLMVFIVEWPIRSSCLCILWSSRFGFSAVFVFFHFLVSSFFSFIWSMARIIIR